MTTGERIKAARKMAGMTQKELADRLGVQFQNISSLERNERKPKIETLKRIADVLDVPISLLVSDTEIQLQRVFEKIHQLDIDQPGIGQEIMSLMEKKAREMLAEQEAIKPENKPLLLYYFDQLNGLGQRQAVERVEELTEIPKYRKTPPQDETRDGEEE